jgi:hypothetical protein
LHRLAANPWLHALGFSPATTTAATTAVFPRRTNRPYSREGLSPYAKVQPILPPLEYDVPYTGKLTVKRVGPEEMRLVCPLPKPGRVTVGCAHVGQGACEIIILDDASLARLGWNATSRGTSNPIATDGPPTIQALRRLEALGEAA